MSPKIIIDLQRKYVNENNDRSSMTLAQSFKLFNNNIIDLYKF
jgi:hypothetical protein